MPAARKSRSRRIAEYISRLIFNAGCGYKRPYTQITDYIINPCPAIAYRHPTTRTYYIFSTCKEGAEKLAEKLVRVAAMYIVTEEECPSGWFEKKRCAGGRRVCAKKPDRGLDFYNMLSRA